MARKINVKLIMELRDAGLSRSTIASTRHISRHSVSEVFNIADEKGIRYDDVRSLEGSEVYRLFYPEKFANETMFGDPDYEHVHQELKRVGVTLKLLHEEYVERCERNGEIPMGKTKFNEGYAEFTVANRLTNHLEHKPGERAEVDWSGPTMHYVDMSTGELITVYLFVGQGAQYPGMGRDLYENYSVSRHVFDQAGEKIKNLCFDGTAAVQSELALTWIHHCATLAPALMLVLSSIAIYKYPITRDVYHQIRQQLLMKD